MRNLVEYPYEKTIFYYFIHSLQKVNKSALLCPRQFCQFDFGALFDFVQKRV